jgi:surface antigen
MLMSAASVHVHAVDMQFLKDAPITRLKGDEVKEFRDVVNKTLDETPQGTTVEWNAPKTSFNSKITPQKSVIDGSFKCRQARIESKATDRQASGDYWFCKDDKRGWGFRTPSKNAQIEKQ